MAPGTTTNCRGHVRRSYACRFSSRTCSSLPPTMSKARCGHLRQRRREARSGRPPRETIAPIECGDLRRGHKCGRGAGARPEVPEAQACRFRPGRPTRPRQLGADLPGDRCRRPWSGRWPHPLREDRSAAFPGRPPARPARRTGFAGCAARCRCRVRRQRPRLHRVEQQSVPRSVRLPAAMVTSVSIAICSWCYE